jgi:hypothetical protein
VQTAERVDQHQNGKRHARASFARLDPAKSGERER